MRDWSTPLATRVPYVATPASDPPLAAAPHEPVVAAEQCDLCGSPDLWWRNCKLVCRNCRSIVKSCADL